MTLSSVVAWLSVFFFLQAPSAVTISAKMSNLFMKGALKYKVKDFMDRPSKPMEFNTKWPQLCLTPDHIRNNRFNYLCLSSYHFNASLISMLKRKLILLACLLNVLNGFAQSKSDWHLQKTENGISVYWRKPENSDFRELKAELTIKATLENLVALISDYDNYSGWVYRCGKSTTLKKLNDTTFMHYQTVEAPWPVEDRDFVVMIKVSQDRKTKVVNFKSTSMPNYIPVDKDHVRVTEIESSWTLVPKDDGTVLAINRILVNPGGSVPAWLVNLAAVDGPYETMLNLKEWIKKKKYAEAKVPFISEVK